MAAAHWAAATAALAGMVLPAIPAEAADFRRLRAE
jgi:hypothetical protein